MDIDRRSNPFGFGVINEVHFNAMPGSYQKLSFEFNSGPSERVLQYAGFYATEPLSIPICDFRGGLIRCNDIPQPPTPQWLQVDDLFLSARGD